MQIAAFFAKGLLTLAVFLVLAAAVIGQSDSVKKDLERSFKRFDLNQIEKVNGSSFGTSDKHLRIQTANRVVELILSPNDLRAPHYRAENDGVTYTDRSPVNTFKGKVAGESESEVRLTIEGSRIEGFFDTDGERFFIEPAKKYSRTAGRGDSVIYRSGDSLNQKEFSCDSDIPGKIEYGSAAVVQNVALGPQASRKIELATEADAQYVATLGGPNAANGEILGILNMVEGSYASELNLSISVVFQHTWTSPDPYAGANTDAILRNFQNYWNSHYSTAVVPRDAAHLFTGKSNALSQGFAFIGVMCNNPLAAYGLSGYVNWAPGKYLITAHEIAHNLGAQHANAAESCENTLMNTQLSGGTPLSFCSFSKNQIGSYLSSGGQSCLSFISTARFDFDGDNRADVAVFRPSTGTWYLNGSSNGFGAIQFGQMGDKAISADYDGDGRSDAGVYRAGSWYIWKSGNNTFGAASFGLPTDIPVPADFDGDRKADVAVYRPSTGAWYWMSSADNGFSARSFGAQGDVPMAADYDGDGKADVAVFRPSNGAWYRINSSTSLFYAAYFGMNGDKPLSGDFDGDRRADLSVFRPSNGVWYILQSSTDSYYGVPFGLPTDIPSAADYDGDGKTDISVYRPSDGAWYRLNSSNNSFSAITFGAVDDDPVPSFYIQ